MLRKKKTMGGTYWKAILDARNWSKWNGDFCRWENHFSNWFFCNFLSFNDCYWIVLVVRRVIFDMWRWSGQKKCVLKCQSSGPGTNREKRRKQDDKRVKKKHKHKGSISTDTSINECRSNKRVKLPCQKGILIFMHTQNRNRMSRERVEIKTFNNSNTNVCVCVCVQIRNSRLWSKVHGGGHAAAAAAAKKMIKTK